MNLMIFEISWVGISRDITEKPLFFKGRKSFYPSSLYVFISSAILQYIVQKFNDRLLIMAVVDDLLSQDLNDNVVSMINGGTFKHFLAIWYSNLVYPALLSGLKNSELNLS